MIRIMSSWRVHGEISAARETLVLVSGTRIYTNQNKKTSYPQKLHVTLKLMAKAPENGWLEGRRRHFLLGHFGLFSGAKC